MFCIIWSVFANLLLNFWWATTLKSCTVLLYFVLKYFRCGMNVSFVLRIIPKNFCLSTISISVSSNCNLGLLCSFFLLQKYTHFVLVFENLNYYLLFICCGLSYWALVGNYSRRKTTLNLKRYSHSTIFLPKIYWKYHWQFTGNKEICREPCMIVCILKWYSIWAKNIMNK